MAVCCCFKFLCLPPLKEKKSSLANELLALASYTSHSAAAGGVWGKRTDDCTKSLMLLLGWVCKSTGKRNQLLIKKLSLNKNLFTQLFSTFLHIAAVNNQIYLLKLSAWRSESHTVGMFCFVHLIFYNLIFLKCEPSGRNTTLWSKLRNFNLHSCLKLFKMALHTGNLKK